MFKLVTLLLLAAGAVYGFNAFAQIRSDVRPPVTAIGSSSSNGVSYAWFYDATERTVIACRIGQGANDLIDCKAKVALP